MAAKEAMFIPKKIRKKWADIYFISRLVDNTGLT
jgi:hypothetical protein